MMLILTGNKGCGKSLLLKGLIADNDVSVQGFLSLKRFTGPDVTGIELLLFPDRKIIPMATTTPITTEASTSRFYFYPDVFSRVNMHFNKLSQDRCFVFDEFGLLEMKREGHYPIFEQLIKSGNKSLIVVRSLLLDDFLSSFCLDIQHAVIDLEKYRLDHASTVILDFLTTQPGKNPG